MQHTLEIGSLALGCCSALQSKKSNCVFLLCFSPFHSGLCKSACKKSSFASVDSYQKCTFSCTRECSRFVTGSTSPSLSEVWFLPLSSPYWSQSSQLPDPPSWFLPLHPVPAATLFLRPSFLRVSGICRCGNGGGKGNALKKLEMDSGHERAEEVGRGEAKGRWWKSHP